MTTKSLRRRSTRLQKFGMDVIVNIIYSVSPRHTDEYYAERARQAAAIKPYRICFKDVGGLLTPDRTRTLFPLIQKNIGSVPLEFHAHCNNGMAPFNYLEAIKLGVDYTAHGHSAAGQRFGPAVDLQCRIQRPGAWLQATWSIWRRSSQSKSIFDLHRQTGRSSDRRAARIRSRAISSSGAGRHDLQPAPSAHEAWDGRQNSRRLWKNARRVRAEFGYPIMVTPLAQFVGSQAAINVITGERYKEVTDQAIQYALGLVGQRSAAVMDANVKDKILSRPRANEWAKWSPPDLSLKKCEKNSAARVYRTKS